MDTIAAGIGPVSRVVLGSSDERDRAVSSVPASAGVVVFEAGDGSAVSVCATGDLRACCVRRLGLGEAGQARGATDLGPVTHAIAWWRVGSAFEADLVWLEVARDRLPQTYAAAIDRWRAWFLHLDADAPTPVWRKVALHQIAAEGIDERTLIGPIADKDATRRFGEQLDSVFDLCRYPKELAQAPNGRACAYKEMGRCPAACDGSETMSSYRARVREAVTLTTSAAGDAGGGGGADSIARARAALDDEMERAVAGQDFERAAVVRDKLASLAKLGKGAFRNAGSLADLALVLVMPSEKRGWARLVRFAGGELTWLAEVEAAGVNQAAGAIGDLVCAKPHAAFPLGVESAERLGLICHEWFAPKKRGRRRRTAVLDVRGGFDRRAFASAVRAAAEPGEGEDDEPAWHDRELGG